MGCKQTGYGRCVCSVVSVRDFARKAATCERGRARGKNDPARWAGARRFWDGLDDSFRAAEANGDEVEASWSWVSRIHQHWAAETAAGKTTLPAYAAGSWGPEEADQMLAADGRAWRLP